MPLGSRRSRQRRGNKPQLQKFSLIKGPQITPPPNKGSASGADFFDLIKGPRRLFGGNPLFVPFWPFLAKRGPKRWLPGVPIGVQGIEEKCNLPMGG